MEANEELIRAARAFASGSPLGKPVARELDKAIGTIRRLADALEAATTEPEWEYGVRRAEPHESGIPWYAHTTGDTLESVCAWATKHDEMVRRRRAGEWQQLPVEGESRDEA